MDASELQAAQARVASYYGGKIRQYGSTPLGVDWTCEPTQQLRFVQLLKVVRPGGFFTLNDIGCGYGALLSFMRQRHRAREFDYLGVDIAQPMIACAQALHGRRRNARFECGQAPSRIADYCLASGIFNVRLDCADDVWQDVVMSTLRIMAAASRRAFAVNFLESSPDAEDGPRELYRTDAARWQAWCGDELGWRCDVLRNYGLREFTLHCFREEPAAPPPSSGR